jgi:hypothetical protein
MNTEKLYSPLKFCLRDSVTAGEGGYGEMNCWRDELSHSEAFNCMDAIELAVLRDRKTLDPMRGMAEYLDYPPDGKIISMFPNIEFHAGRLWCVAEVVLSEPLTPDETDDLKNRWSGQLSDGWGEGFSQHPAKVSNGELFFKLRKSDDSFFIDTEREFRQGLRLDSIQAAVETPCAAAPDLRVVLKAIIESEASRYPMTLNIPYTDKEREEVADFLGAVGFWDPTADLHITENADISVKLSSDTDIGRALIPLLTERESLAEVNVLCGVLRICSTERLSGIYDELIHGNGASVAQMLAAIKNLKNEATIPAPEFEALKERLFERFDQNLADGLASCRAELARPGMTDAELRSAAWRIASACAAHELMKNGFEYKDGDVEYLLRFRYPLQIVAAAWPDTPGEIMDMSDIVRDVLEAGGSHEDLPLAPAAPEADREPPVCQRGDGRTSVLDVLRRARENPPERGTKPGYRKPAPEL